MMVKLYVPAKLVSEANMREHWAVEMQRKKKQKAAVRWAWISARPIVPPKPWLITLIRIGPRKLDSDNLAGSGKACRDELADILGFDDGDDSVATWEYAQRKGLPKEYGLEIEIRRRQS